MTLGDGARFLYRSRILRGQPFALFLATRFATGKRT